VTRTLAGISDAKVGTADLVAAHALAAGAVSIAIVGGYRALTPNEEVVLAACVLIAAVLTGLRLVTGVTGCRRSLAAWRIGPWYMLYAVFGFGVASFTWTLPQRGTPAIIEQSSVITALYAVAAAITAVAIAYRMGTPGIFLTAGRRLIDLTMHGRGSTLSTSRKTPWMLYGIGIASRLLSLVLQGQYGYLGNAEAAVASTAGYNQLLSLGGSLAIAGIALGAFNFFAARVRGANATLAALLVCELGFAVISGNKEPFVVAALAVMVPYGIVKQRLPTKALAIGVVVFLVILVPFNVAYRSAIRSSSGTLSASQAISEAPKILADSIEVDSISGVAANSYQTLLQRIRLIDGMAIIMQKTPSIIDYRSPAEYVYTPAIGLIPRAVWPDKPVFTAGYRLSQEYYEIPSGIVTSSTATTLGGFYQHGGWISLILLSIALGGSLRLFDNIFRPETDPKAMFFVIAFFPTLVKSEVDSVELVVSLPLLVLTGVVAARLATTRHRDT
jgi:hypothetical protein